jgi:two-component system response regulator FlrC
VSQPRRLLIVDDERVMVDYLKDLLQERYEVHIALSGREALGRLAAQRFDLVLTDLQLEREDGGMEIVAACSDRPDPLPVVVMTAYASVGAAVEAMKRGAREFLAKPFGGKELNAVLANVLGDAKPGDVLHSDEIYALPGDKHLVVGTSAAMRSVMEMVETVAPTRATVMLTGESGTGKELIASAVHAMSRRARGPFIKVNCSAITDTLLESTLFGHEKGAFTGAIKRTAGKFELANSGTLLLDEISEMKPELQSKLLRVLQEREFELVGGTQTLAVDVRIIATSNRNMREEVGKGRFREDLFFRLNVLPIHLPPLRERNEDIPHLVRHFIGAAARDNGLPRPALPDSLLAELVRRSWPGNVRQLQNAIERAVVLSRGRDLRLADFLLDDDGLPASAAEKLFTVDMTLREMEERMIKAALARCRENRTQAARQLGISVRTLRNKLNLYRSKSRSAAA